MAGDGAGGASGSGGEANAEQLLATLSREYELCNEFYNSRDFIAGDLFTKLLQTFTGLAAILVAVSVFGQAGVLLYYAIVITIGVFGLVSFVSLTLDIQGACSVKVAARRRAQDIEKELRDVGGPQIWTRIEVRDRFWEEELLKEISGEPDDTPDPPRTTLLMRLLRRTPRLPRSGERETEGVLFIFAGRLLVLAWTILVVVSLVVFPG